MQFRLVCSRSLLCLGVWVLFATVSLAQTLPVIQFFVPGEGLPSREIRFTLERNGLAQPLKSDAKGKYQMTGSGGEGTFTIYVEGNKRSYAFTTIVLTQARNLTHIPIFLRSLPDAPPFAGKPVTDDAAPAEAAAAYETALKAAAENKSAVAISELTRALMLHPAYLRALNLLADIYVKLALPDLAAAALTQALSLNPAAHTARQRLALLWQQQGRFDQSLQLFSQLLQDQPTLSALRLNYAEALSATNQWDEAETQLRLALQDPQLDAQTRANAHIKLGIKLNRDGRPQAVAVEFAKAVELNPDGALMRLYLGAAYMQINKLAEAERELLKGYELGGKSVSNAQLLLGQVYVKQQKPEQALRAYEQFLADAPNSSNAAAARAAIEKIKAEIKTERK
jgi:tetratricopeptide (TPR) repeat protein